MNLQITSPLHKMLIILLLKMNPSQILGIWPGRLDATSPQSKLLACFVGFATKETSWNRSCLPAVVLDQWVNWWLSRQSDKFPSGRSCPPQLPGEVVVLLPVRHMWALQVRLAQLMFNLGHCSSRQPLTVTRRYRPVLQWLCQGENSGDDQRNLVILMAIQQEISSPERCSTSKWLDPSTQGRRLGMFGSANPACLCLRFSLHFRRLDICKPRPGGGGGEWTSS